MKIYIKLFYSERNPSILNLSSVSVFTKLTTTMFLSCLDMFNKVCTQSVRLHLKYAVC